MPAIVGILALQGDFAAHQAAFAQLGAATVLVRFPAHLSGIDVLAMPGGESTTMSLLLDRSGLRGPLTERIAAGLPVLATCAGVILLATKLTGDTGSVKVMPMGLLDAEVDRNSYGRQVNSFEGMLSVDWAGLGLPEEQGEYRGVFIRAPRITSAGAGCSVLARDNGGIALMRQGSIIAATFHPELSGDLRIHRALLQLAA